MGGVRHERQCDVLVRLTVDPLVVHPKVVFDITWALQVQKSLWNKASECFCLQCIPKPSPHQRPLAWSRTGRRSDRGPYGSHWPRHSVDPWKQSLQIGMEGEGQHNTYAQIKLRGKKRWRTPYRWGIPMITLSMPAALDLSMMVLRAGMSTSQPSRPKRFSDDHFLARKSSNLDIKKAERHYFPLPGSFARLMWNDP